VDGSVWYGAHDDIGGDNDSTRELDGKSGSYTFEKRNEGDCVVFFLPICNVYYFVIFDVIRNLPK
jgi:hypothetical protein